jgi:hypothetical protein
LSRLAPSISSRWSSRRGETSSDRRKLKAREQTGGARAWTDLGAACTFLATCVHMPIRLYLPLVPSRPTVCPLVAMACGVVSPAVCGLFFPSHVRAVCKHQTKAIHACMFLHVYIHIALLIQGIFVAIDMLQGKYILFLINHTISNIFLIHGIRLQLSIHTCLWAWPILVETQLQHMLHLISSMNHEEIQRSKAIVTHAYHKSRGNTTAHTFIFLVATLVATTKISGATYISMNHDAILWFRSRLELS